MTALLCTLALTCSLLLAARCAVADPITIVAFGDSTTAPRGKLAIYADLLQQELHGVQVINSGLGGHTTEMGRARFERDVLAHQPRIVIIQFGINDAAVDVAKTPPATGPRVALTRYEENLRYFVQALKARKAAVVLMTPNPLRWTKALKDHYGLPPYDPEDPEGMNPPMVPFCEACRRVAKEEGVELIDMQTEFLAEAKRLSQPVDALLLDGMHPNAIGHRLEANLLRERILNLAKRESLPVE